MFSGFRERYQGFLPNRSSDSYSLWFRWSDPRDCLVLSAQDPYQFSVLFNRVGVDLDEDQKEEPSSHQASQRTVGIENNLSCSVSQPGSPILKGAISSDKTNQDDYKMHGNSGCL